MIYLHLAAPTASDALRQAFIDACNTPSSINGLLTAMRDTASGCEHITEFGVGDGWSTLAWLVVQPAKLLLVDTGFQACFPRLEAMRGRTEITYWVADDRMVEIEETDLLFIDTIHTFDMLKEELLLHGNKARKFLVFHDTTTFGDRGEDSQVPGLWGAIEQWVTIYPDWQLHTRLQHSNGLTILQRKSAFDVQR